MPVINVGGNRYKTYGTVICGESVGDYEIYYDDWIGENLPIQTLRRNVRDNVYISDTHIGLVDVEWDDTISGATSGSQVLKINTSVKLWGRVDALIIGEAEFQIQDSWAKGIQTHEAIQPALNQALASAAVVSLIKELLEAML